MNRMRCLVISLLLLAATSSLPGATRPLDRLLPQDTLLLIHAPDWSFLRQAVTNSPIGRIWIDSATQPFRENLSQHFEREIGLPWLAAAGITTEDLLNLPEGQVAFAVTRNHWEGPLDQPPAVALLVDVGPHEQRLEEYLCGLEAKLSESGSPLERKLIQDVPFLQVTFPTESPSGHPLFLGRAESLLLVSDTTSVLEGILRRAGSTDAQPCLKDNPDYADALLDWETNAAVQVWIHTRPVIGVFSRMARDYGSSSPADDSGLSMPGPEALLRATGLTALGSVSLSWTATEAGNFSKLRLGLPEEARTGVLSLMAPSRLDSSPPLFVPADVQWYQRYRVDLRKAWMALEETVRSMFPSAGGAIDLMFSTLSSLGKADNPEFEMRAELVGLLGNDLIAFSKSPVDPGLSGLDSGPSLLLIGSSDAQRTVGAMKLASLLLPPPMNLSRERTEAGTTVTEIPLQDQTSETPPGEANSPESFHFAASQAFIAMSTHRGALSSYLNTPPSPTVPALVDLPGLREAAEQVGGFDTGLFGYENDRLAIGALVKALKADASIMDKIIALAPSGTILRHNQGGGLLTWIDLSLLPEFDQIEEHFHFTVYAVQVNPRAVIYRSFSPVSSSP